MECPYCGNEREDLDEHIRMFHPDEYWEWQVRKMMDEYMQKASNMTYVQKTEPGPTQLVLELTRLALQFGKSPREVKDVYDEMYGLVYPMPQWEQVEWDCDADFEEDL